MFEYERIISEGAGAAGVTAIIENLSLFKNKKVCSIICGGNIDSRIYAGILNKKLSRDGRLIEYVLALQMSLACYQKSLMQLQKLVGI